MEKQAYAWYRISTNIGEELNLANWHAIAKFKSRQYFFYSVSIVTLVAFDFAKYLAKFIISTNRQYYMLIFVLIWYMNRGVARPNLMVGHTIFYNTLATYSY